MRSIGRKWMNAMKLRYAISSSILADVVSPINMQGKILITLPLGSVIMNPEHTIMDFQASFDTNSPNNEENFQPLKGKISPGDIHFSTKDNIQYGVTSPLYYILLDSFNLKINSQTFFVQIPKDVIYEEATEIPLETSKYIGMMNSVEKKFLPQLSHSLYSQFSSVEDSKIPQKFVELAIQSSLQELTIDSKIEYRGIAGKIEFLKEKMANLQISLDLAEDMAEKSANRRLKFVFGGLLLQIIAIQYGTYYAFSWDIMEPITCLLGIFDLIIAYGFWLRNEMPYSFEALWKRILEKRRKKYQRKLGVSSDLVDEITEEISRLTIERDLRSEKLSGISSVLNRNETK